jgi:hypothetical protein
MLLLPLLFMYIAIGLGKAFGARMGQLAARLVPEEEIATPQVEALRLRMHRMLGLITGAVIARTVARKESRFLLKDEFGVGIFLGLVRLQAFGKGRRGLH